MAKYSKDFLDQLRQAVPLHDLVEGLVVWDKGKTNAAKRDYWACCPLHREKSPSFHVLDDEHRFHCFGCGESGDHFEFLMQTEHLNFVEAVARLAEIARIGMPQLCPIDQAESETRIRLLEVMAAADKWFYARWSEGGDEVDTAKTYLVERGITGELAKRFRIGFAPKQGLRKHLELIGYSTADLMAAGLIGQGETGAPYDRFRSRLMFPIHDQRDRVIAFGGRSIVDEKRVPKYINSPDTPLYDKSRTLFNWPSARQATRKCGEVVVVEGYLDVIALAARGHEAVVAACGTAITAEQLTQLWRHAREPVMAFDGDAAGQAALTKAVNTALPQLRPGQTIRLAVLPEGRDPDDMMATEEGQAEFAALVDTAEPLSDVVWRTILEGNDRSTPERQAAFVDDVVSRLAEIDNKQVRAAYVERFQTRCTQELGMKARQMNLSQAVGRKRQARTRRVEAAAESSLPHESETPGEQEWGVGAETAGPALLTDIDTDLDCAGYELTDIGNAERFDRRNAHRFAWCDAYGWLAYDGKRWDRSSAEHKVVRAVQATVKQIAEEASALIETEADQVYVEADRNKPPMMHSQALRKWGKSSQAAPKRRSILSDARSELLRRPSEFDADIYKLNVANGTLEFGVAFDDFVRFRPHDHRDLITKMAPVTYDPAATSPAYDKFMAWAQPEETDRDYIHQCGGLCLTGDASEQCFFYWYGSGGNGKSTVIDLWSRVLGDYVATIPIDALIDSGRAQTGDRATPEWIDAVGARLLKSAEPKKRAHIDEGLIKDVTGGEPKKVRDLMRPFFDFRPQFKLFIQANYKPIITGTDEGIWRRIQLVPWNASVTEDQKDRHLVGKLFKAEASGILNRLVEGLQTWFREGGLRKSKSVYEATATLREQSDPLGQFLDDCCELTGIDEHRVKSSELYSAFEAWCAANDEKTWTPKGFGSAMLDRGIERRKLSTNHYVGLKLLTEAGYWWQQVPANKVPPGVNGA